MHGNSQNTAPAVHPQNQPQTPQPFCIHHDFEGAAELSTTLAHALADVTGADVTEAEFSLADHVDPDALDRLFTPAGNRRRESVGHFAFTVWGHGVTVYADGQIVISPPRQQRPPNAPL